jgi:hypothetical protein
MKDVLYPSLIAGNIAMNYISSNGLLLFFGES